MSDNLIERVARALWAIDCRRGDEDERRAGRNPPERWADPWHPSGCGVRQQKTYLEDARAAIAAMEPELQRMLAALADIGGADDMDEKARRAKATRIYAEMQPIIDAAIDEALK